MSRPTGTPVWARRSDLVVCVGGPRDGAWYYAPDLAAAEQAAVTVATRSGRAAPSHGYRDTGQLAPHPHYSDAAGHVYRWQPVALELEPWRSRYCAVWDEHDRCAGSYPADGIDPANGVRVCVCSCHPAAAGNPAVLRPAPPASPPGEAPPVRSALPLAG